MPVHNLVLQNKPYGDLNSLVNQNIEILDVVLQHMSEMEHFRSDLRQSSPDGAPNHAHNEESKAALTVPGFPGRSQINCRTKQIHAISRARENAIASLIILANIVPIYFFRSLTQITANEARR